MIHVYASIPCLCGCFFLHRDAVSDLALHFLNKMKILVVRDIERDEIEFICKVQQINLGNFSDNCSVYPLIKQGKLLAGDFWKWILRKH